VSEFADVFRAQRRTDDAWEFELEERFNGAFGGTNGGVAAAVSLWAARARHAGWIPAAIDCHFLKGCKPGTARVSLRTLNEGRTLTVIATETRDHTSRMCTTALVTLVHPAMLDATISVPAGRCVATDPSGKAQRWQHPKGHRIPLIDSFAPEIVASSTDSITTRIELPFEVGDATAEAVCIAADISVGPPVGRAVAGRASLPNPNLALRFCGTSRRGRTLQSRCRLVQIHAGLACTEIEVGSDEVLLATGTSMTTCLPPGLR